MTRSQPARSMTLWPSLKRKWAYEKGMTAALEYGSVNFLATLSAALPRMKARWLRACGSIVIKGGTDESGRL